MKSEGKRIRKPAPIKSSLGVKLADVNQWFITFYFDDIDTSEFARQLARWLMLAADYLEQQERSGN